MRARAQIHTPDSSRYWMAGSYEERHAAGLEPQNIDKEFLRLWFRDHCDPYKDEVRQQLAYSEPRVAGWVAYGRPLQAWTCASATSRQGLCGKRGSAHHWAPSVL